MSRRGNVEYVTVGDAFRIDLPDFKRVRGGAGRFRGLRCIHTHLRGEKLTRDDLTDLALLRLDAMVAIEVDDAGVPSRAHYASLRPPGEADGSVDVHEPLPPARLDFDFLEWIEALEDRFAQGQRGIQVEGEGERAILVGLMVGPDKHAEERMIEMRELARSAGVGILDTIIQRRTQPDPRYVLGKGKIQDLVVRAWQQGADLVLFDRDLSPTQIRHITDLVEARIVDRTQLILDIFAQHATTRAGKVQVELAQLRYRLPRLAGRGESMSRLAGGIGGRGPGEMKLEVDRRRARDRIRRLERELQQIAQRREQHRAKRRRAGLPVVSIVGYTNAGKSTLLNRLTRSEVHTADQLFATLDSSARRLHLPVRPGTQPPEASSHARDVILTDTVGFIRDLPADLVAGFRSTLEEIQDACVLLHVVDASNPSAEEQVAAVRETLSQLDLGDKPELLVLNKSDRLPPEQAEHLAARLGGVAVSALSGAGLDPMLYALQGVIRREAPPLESTLAVGGA